MNKLTPIFTDSYRIVDIKWHHPIPLVESQKELRKIDQDNTFLYKIVAKRGAKFKLIYIGMAERQTIHLRLYNKDHQIKQSLMKEENNGWVLYVSIGEFLKKEKYESSFRWAKKNIKIIEKLLIVTHSEVEYLHNKKDVKWFNSGSWIQIKNYGFRDDKMYKTINYGPSTS